MTEAQIQQLQPGADIYVICTPNDWTGKPDIRERVFIKYAPKDSEILDVNHRDAKDEFQSAWATVNDVFTSKGDADAAHLSKFKWWVNNTLKIRMDSAKRAFEDGQQELAELKESLRQTT